MKCRTACDQESVLYRPGMRSRAFFISLCCLAASACQAGSHQWVPGADEREERGEALASMHCASCHAISLTDESRHPDAPALREISQAYPVEMLGEALAEGILVGHPDMPVFSFAPSDIEALLSYLESIQETG